MDCQFFRQVVFVFYKYVKQNICSSVSLRVLKSFVSCFQKRKYDTESTQMQTIYEYKYDPRKSILALKSLAKMRDLITILTLLLGISYASAGNHSNNSPNNFQDNIY